jgi:hypothetical protein
MISVCTNAAFALSHHATTRMAQRGIRSEALELVLSHGTRIKAGGACEEYVLTDRTGRHLQSEGYDGRAVATAKKIRAIVNSEGVVVTCYHQRNARSLHRDH